MAKVSVSMPLPADPTKVWDMIGGFNSLADWHPAIETSEIEGEGKGSVRTLTLAGGGQIVERLEQLDDEGRLYRYSFVSGPLPVANYTGTIKITPGDQGGCTVEWSGEFEAAGAPEADAVKVMRDIYDAGLENLKKMLGG